MSIRHLAPLLVALLGACGTASDDLPPVETTSDTIAFDGVLLMRHPLEDSTRRYVGRLYLLDTNTGKLSPRAWDSRIGNGYAISPDGTRVAYVIPGEERTLVLTEVAFTAEGNPTLEELRRWTLPDVVHEDESELAFTPDGERLYTAQVWVDPESGAMLDCIAEHDLHERHALHNRTRLVHLGDGRHFVCTNPGRFEPVLYDDFTPVRTGIDAYPQQPSSMDLQWYGPGWHLPSFTVVEDLRLEFGDLPFVGGSAQTDSGWQGFRRFTDTGYDGYVGVTICNDERSVAEPAPIERQSFNRAFDEVSAFSDEPWDTPAEAVAGFVAEQPGEYRAWELIGFVESDTEREAVYHVHSGDFDASCPPAFTKVSHALVSVGIDSGALRAVDLQDEPWALTSGSEYKLVDGPGSDWIANMRGHLVGFRGADAVVMSDTALLSASREWRLYPRLWAEFDYVDRDPTICVARPTLGATRRCMPHPSQGEVVGILLEGRYAETDGPPVLRGLSRAATYHGADLVLTGARFGTSGQVLVDGEPVAAEFVESWADDRIVLRPGPGFPPAGSVVVETGAGRSQDAWPFQHFVTERHPTPFDGLPVEPVEIRQGLGTLELDFEPTGIALPQGLTIALDERDADGRYYVYGEFTAEPQTFETRVWAGEGGAYENVLPVTWLPGLAPTEGAWQVIGTRMERRYRGGLSLLEYHWLAGYPFNHRSLTSRWEEAGGFRPVQLDVTLRNVPLYETVLGAVYAVQGVRATQTWQLITDVLADGSRVEEPLGIENTTHLKALVTSGEHFLFWGGLGGVSHLQLWDMRAAPRLVVEQLDLPDFEFRAAIGAQRGGEPVFVLHAAALESNLRLVDAEGLRDEVLPLPNPDFDRAPTHFHAASGSHVLAASRRHDLPHRIDLDAAEPAWVPAFAPSLLGDAAIIGTHHDPERGAVDFLLDDGRVLRVPIEPGAVAEIDLSSKLVAPHGFGVEVAIHGAMQRPDGSWQLEVALTEPGTSDASVFFAPGLTSDELSNAEILVPAL